MLKVEMLVVWTRVAASDRKKMYWLQCGTVSAVLGVATGAHCNFTEALLESRASAQKQSCLFSERNCQC